MQSIKWILKMVGRKQLCMQGDKTAETPQMTRHYQPIFLTARLPMLVGTVA